MGSALTCSMVQRQVQACAGNGSIGATSLPYLRQNCSCSWFVARTSANINVGKFRLGIAKILQIYLGQLLHWQSELTESSVMRQRKMLLCVVLIRLRFFLAPGMAYFILSSKERFHKLFFCIWLKGNYFLEYMFLSLRIMH